ncbi:CPCC family cysteine-rich protein [Virgisporangium aurantiacum]|uniref:CPCC family cysteine-rich protein n=1 Tax=Virgisporangium aurantiacum TaxID=175570 RepID=UPI001EF171E9|nr:CPCC family cysteine-rich protein [Virgisporangium aurantiacum]
MARQFHGVPAAATAPAAQTCPVCYWTHDGASGRHSGAAFDGLNGERTLDEARLNYSIYGASARRYRDMVRPPRPDEQP